jgi:hypothetical protein
MKSTIFWAMTLVPCSAYSSTLKARHNVQTNHMYVICFVKASLTVSEKYDNCNRLVQMRDQFERC